MEIINSYHSKDEHIETASGNKVSRQTILCGSQNIATVVSGGKTALPSIMQQAFKVQRRPCRDDTKKILLQ
uniref:Uncharacterized protein n=1 Tax=Glossina morsitans morsitans TaxID=37546 RepID=A0A1B0FQ73_GLOMM